MKALDRMLSKEETIVTKNDTPRRFVSLVGFALEKYDPEVTNFTAYAGIIWPEFQRTKLKGTKASLAITLQTIHRGDITSEASDSETSGVIPHGYLTIPEAVKHSGKSRRMIYYWIRDRILPSIRRRNRQLVAIKDLDRITSAPAASA